MKLNTEFLKPITKTFDVSLYKGIKHVPAKVPASTLLLKFLNPAIDNVSHECTTHSQQLCTFDLKFPYAASGLRTFLIRQSKVLVDADPTTAAKRTVELELIDELTTTSSCMPGDTIAILPSNSTKLVEYLLDRLNLTVFADAPCCITASGDVTRMPVKPTLHIPAQTTPRLMLADCLELNAVPKKQFLSALAACAVDADERNFLGYLSSREGASSNLYERLILTEGLRLPDILEICVTCQPTLALLVQHLPRLLPRPYSIANSPQVGANNLSIIYSVLPRNAGVTTAWLEEKAERLAFEKDVPIIGFLRQPSLFRFTECEVFRSQLLIGVGTALAAFISFLQYKPQQQRQQQQQQQPNCGQTWLYAGAKTPKTLIKREFLQQCQASNVLQVFRQAYSRAEPEPEPEPKPEPESAALNQESCGKYVQDILKADTAAVIDFINEPTTTVYVCGGSVDVNRSIRSTIKEMLMAHCCQSESEAEQMLAAKIREDAWL